MRDAETEAKARLRDFAARFAPAIHAGVVEDKPIVPDSINPAVKEAAVPNADLPSDYDNTLAKDQVRVPTPAESIRAGDIVTIKPLIATGYRFPSGVDRIELLGDGQGKFVVDYSMVAKIEKGHPATPGDICRLMFASEDSHRYRLVSRSDDRKKGWFEPLDRSKGEDDIIRRLDQMVRL